MIFFLFFSLHALCFKGDSHAALYDRVIAFVDDHAITLSELEENYKNTNILSRSVTHEEVLNTMINRVILLKEAKKYRIEAPTIDEVLKEYIDLKIRAFIRVNDADIEKFYNANRQNFQGRDYEDVRDEIDMFLTEKELNERLKVTLNELRKKTYIRIYLDTE
ncbi:MAG: hypothetical protein HZA15_16780 [Nitrospirae bacterium]|nr:hypothetical protein [Nitrospirota bacterium]